MTRLEENSSVIEEMVKRIEIKPTGTYEEMMTFQLGAISTMLTDISKSLAILADKAESKEMVVVNNGLKDLSERVENIEKQMKEDKENQLKKLKAEVDYAKFRCAL